MRIGSIVIVCAEFERMVAFWQEALHYVPKRPPKDGWVILTDPTGKGPNISLDHRPTRRSVRSRLHLDLYADDQKKEVERLVAIGRETLSVALPARCRLRRARRSRRQLVLRGGVMFDLIAVLSAGLFAGAAAYVLLVEHPARIGSGAEIAVKEFGPSYHRGAFMQVALTLVTLGASIAAWFQSREPTSLIAGLLLGALIPYTMIAIFPTNKRLLDPQLDPRSAEAARLLRKWGRLHAVRAIVGALAFALLVSRLRQG
jgi:hypothetical protein